MSLVELLVVIAISSILLMIATPSFSSFLAALQIRQATDALFSDMMLAKSEAIKRNSRVVICKSANGSACTPDGGWEHGWIVFQDTDNSGSRESNEELVKLRALEKPAATISGNGNISRYVSFSGIGATKLLSGAFQAGTFTVCPSGHAELQGRQVVINSTGRVRLTKAPASLCH